MLDLVYIAIVAVPLVLAGGGLLLLAIRSVFGPPRERRAPEAKDVAVPAAPPAPFPGISELAAALAFPPRTLPSTAPPPSASAPPPSASAPPPSASAPPPLASAPPPAASAPPPPPSAPPPLAAVRPVAGDPGSVAGLAAKRCPDCAEEVLAAARVCKHCRYRWEESGGSALSA
jgi:hypothetical protein